MELVQKMVISNIKAISETNPTLASDLKLTSRSVI